MPQDVSMPQVSAPSEVPTCCKLRPSEQPQGVELEQAQVLGLEQPQDVSMQQPQDVSMPQDMSMDQPWVV